MRDLPKHRKFVQSLPCVACAKPAPSECAHVRMSRQDVPVPHSERGGTALKPGDAWTVPLCHDCHRIQHNVGERWFWDKYGIDPLELAKALHRNSGHYTAGLGIVGRARMGAGL